MGPRTVVTVAFTPDGPTVREICGVTLTVAYPGEVGRIPASDSYLACVAI